MTSDRNSWNCLSSEGAICEQGLALRHCGTCKLQYLEAHFRKKRRKWNNVYYLTHHEEKPLPSLPAKCPDVTTHGVQSYVMWKINLWQTMLSCTRGYHLKFSSIFCKVLLPHHHSEIENIEQHDGHDQNKGLLSYRHPTTRLWSLILAAPIPHLLWYKSALLSLDISGNPYSTWFNRVKSG